jgi:hypothetical protein
LIEAINATIDFKTSSLVAPEVLITTDPVSADCGFTLVVISTEYEYEPPVLPAAYLHTTTPAVVSRLDVQADQTAVNPAVGATRSKPVKSVPSASKLP